MAINLRKFLLAAFVLVVLSLCPQTEATVTKSSNFDSYVNVVKQLTNMNSRLTIFRAVWGEIRADYDDNLDEVKTFYDNLQLYTVGAVNAEAEEAAELIELVRNVLIKANGRLLAETLNRNGSQSIVAVEQFRTKLLNNYASDLLNGIFEYAIDAAYLFQPTDSLHSNLNAIDLRIITNAKVYQLKVHWNLYLYYKFLQRGDVNEHYLYLAGMAFHNMRWETYYNTLSKDNIRRINEATAKLPSSLGNLFNSTTVCLANANFVNFYLYFKEPLPTFNAVQTVISNANFQHTVWMNSFASQVLTEQSTVNFRTPNRLWILYRRFNDNFVVVQSSDTSATYRNWSPILKDNKIIFDNNGYYLCATSTYDNTLQGFLVKTIATNSDDLNCQWIVTDCSELRS